MPTRFIAADDLTPQQTWQLAEWCVAHGAEEFSVTSMSLQGHQQPFNDRFLAAVEPYRIDEARRPHATTYVGDDPMRPAELWRALPELVAILKQFFREGLFTYMTSAHEEGWLEDPTFYRDGALFLAIVSHEREGYLELTALEAAELSALGIQTRDRRMYV
jgi:hypothetical protein